MLHRDSQKRFYGDDFIYFVTCSTRDREPYFREPILCEAWIEELKLCQEMKEFDIHAFCLLHDHFHLLVQPGTRADISEVMFSTKKQFSHNANRILGYNDLLKDVPNFESKVTIEGEQALVRLQAEHQKKTASFREQFAKKYKSGSLIFPKFKWQRSFHDHVIRNENDFEAHWNYTTYNFLKHELPDDWSYTSLRFPLQFSQ